MSGIVDGKVAVWSTADHVHAVRLGQLSLGHAKVIKGVSGGEKQIHLCRETIFKHLSVHALELLARETKSTANEEPLPLAKAPVEKTAHVQSLENDLRQKLSTRVEIKVKSKEKGQIVIGFDSNDDFERIVSCLTR